MLKNDPPPSTEIRFLRKIEKATAYSRGTLVRAVGTHGKEDRPEDLFEVEYLGERMTVRRDDIEET